MELKDFEKLPLRDRMTAQLLTRYYTSKKVEKFYPEANWDKWSKDTLAFGYSVVDELMRMINETE